MPDVTVIPQVSVWIGDKEFRVGGIKASAANLEVLELLMSGKFPIARIRVLLEEALLAGGERPEEFLPALDSLGLTIAKGSALMTLYRDFATSLLG